jgi:hypothetical protein
VEKSIRWNTDNFTRLLLLKQTPLLGFVGGLILQEKRQFGGMNRKMFGDQMTNEPGEKEGRYRKEEQRAVNDEENEVADGIRLRRSPKGMSNNRGENWLSEKLSSANCRGDETLS